MRQIVSRIATFGDQKNKIKGAIKVRGNLDFIEILDTYSEFTDGMETFEKTKRGRPTENPSPVEIDYLVHLVNTLYHDKGKKYSSYDRGRLKDLLNRAADGSDFFDPIKSKHWIDMFSALDYNLHLFSKSENTDFSIFYSNYISFYTKLNNKKLVPFYARWLKEIAAMYTIYQHETYQEFEQTQALLQAALEDGIACGTHENASRYETGDMRNHIMTNIFVACCQDKTSILDKLCEYIRANPGEFVYESGELIARYRRYYYTIKEMLQWLDKNGEYPFVNDRFMRIFAEEDVSYDLKDSNIRDFEISLVKEMLFLSRSKENSALTTEEERRRLEFFVKDTVKFDKKKNDEIVCEISDAPFQRKRTPEEVVDSVVKLLRFIIMLTILERNMNDDINDYEFPSRREVVHQINQAMTRMGLLPIAAKLPISYNDNSFMDFCVRKYIEEIFEED